MLIQNKILESKYSAKKNHLNLLEFVSKLCETVNNTGQLWKNQIKSIAKNDQISVVTNITWRSSKMNNWGGKWTLLSKNVHMSHYIVTGFTFFICSCLEIDFIPIGFHLFDLFIGYFETKLLQRREEKSTQLKSPSSVFAWLHSSFAWLICLNSNGMLCKYNNIWNTKVTCFWPVSFY